MIPHEFQNGRLAFVLLTAWAVLQGVRAVINGFAQIGLVGRYFNNRESGLGMVREAIINRPRAARADYFITW